MGEAKRRKAANLPPTSPTRLDDRRAQRSRLQNTWSVYASEDGSPIRKQQRELLEDEPAGTFVDQHGLIQRGRPKDNAPIVLESKTGDEDTNALLLAAAAKQTLR